MISNLRGCRYTVMYLRDVVAGLFVLFARFVSGRCLDGRRRTNATFVHAGTSVMTVTGRASRWSHMPGYQRAAWRLAATAAVIGTSIGLLFFTEATIVTLRVAFLSSLLPASWAGYEKGSEWTHRKKIVALAKAMAEKAGHSSEADPFRWIEAPKGYKKDSNKRVTLTMGEKFNANDSSRKAMARQSARKLGLRDEYEDEWMDEERTQLSLRAKPLPPAKIYFDEVREIFEACPDNEMVMGLGSRGRPKTVSLDGDSPHMLVSMGSGGGKSKFGQSCAKQRLRKGDRVVIIDIVKHGNSHKWAKGVVGVEVIRHADVAHDVLLEIQADVERRCESAFLNDEDEIGEQRVFVIIEESNQTIRSLNRYWRNDMEMRGMSPAVLAIEGILCVGREARYNVLAVAQRGSAQATGGGDARENYGVRVGNRYSKQTANMLFADVDPLPKSYNRPGLVQVVVGTDAELVQVPLLDDSESLTWALEGRPQRASASRADANARLSIAPPMEDGDDVAGGVATASSAASDTASESRVSPDHVGDTARSNLRHLRLVSDEDEATADEALVSLREAVTQEIVSVSQAVLRNERQRDPEFPHSVDRRGSGANAQHLYRPKDLVRWERNRAARREEEDGGGAS